MAYKLNEKDKKAFENLKRNIKHIKPFPQNLEFFGGFCNGIYFEKSELLDFYDKKRQPTDLTVCLNADTEYYTKDSVEFGKPEMIDGYVQNYQRGTRQAITSQFKGVYRDKGLIFVSPDFAQNKHIDIRHPVATSGFHAVDYLQHRGYDIHLSRIGPDEDRPKRRMYFKLYAHFGLVEYLMIVDGSYIRDFQDFVPSLYLKSRLIFGRSYLGEPDYATLPWKVLFHGKYFQVCVTIVDTGAMHGVASYKNTCIACGTNIDDKDLLDDPKLKMNMHKVYSEKPDEYDKYSLGDLNCYENLMNNSENFFKIYETLRLESFSKQPELTIGATTKDLFIGVVGKDFDLDNRDEKLIAENLNIDNKRRIYMVELYDKKIEDLTKEELDEKRQRDKEFIKALDGKEPLSDEELEPLKQEYLEGLKTKHDFDYLDSLKYIEPIGDEQLEEYQKGYSYYFLGKFREFLNLISKEVRDMVINNFLYTYHIKHKIYTISKDNNDQFKDKGNVLKSILKYFISESNAKELKFYAKDKRHLNSKVYGGRCHNNKPSQYKDEGILVDIDIDGCYGNGMRNQTFAFGKPIVLGAAYGHNTKNNDYMTLGKFLKRMKWGKQDCHLVPGLFTIIGDTKRLLTYKQDLIASWFGFNSKDVKDMTNPNSTALDVNTGEVKILEREIVNGVITWDVLQYIFNVFTSRERNDLLDKFVVKTAIYYPAYERCNSIDELLTKHYKHEGKNISQSHKKYKSNKTVLVNINEECHAWYGVNMGEMLIDELLANRKMYPKKTPMNTLYKLLINTLYGTLVSPFFDHGNVVVGNNITARARVLGLMMEKGFYSWQTITDGGVFNINKVVFPKTGKNLYANRLIDLDSKTLDEIARYKLCKFGSLGGFDNIELEYVDKEPKMTFIKGKSRKVIEGWKNIQPEIDKLAFQHLQKLFPGMDILHKESTLLSVEKDEGGKPKKIYKKNIGQFNFESKGIFTQGVFHGSANYLLKNPNETIYKYRSYQKVQTDEINFDDDNEVQTDKYENENPANNLLTQLSQNENGKLKRQKVSYKSGILKPNEFNNNSDKYKKLGQWPGDSIIKCNLLTELSMAQFHYQTKRQYLAIQKEANANKNKYGQSYEFYFIDEDGYLNYPKMIKRLNEIILSGKYSINKQLDEHRNKERDLIIEHPQLETKKLLKQYINGDIVSEKVKNIKSKIEKETIDLNQIN